MFRNKKNLCANLVYNMEIKINANDILMALGYKDTSASEFIIEQAKLAAKKANNMSKPQSTYKTVKIEKMDGNQIIFETGDAFECESMARGLKACSHIIVAIATIGKGIDEAVSAAFKEEDSLMGMMLDAAGSRLVSCYANLMWKEFVDSQDVGMGITEGFAPGSNDFTLDQQSVVFNILDAASINVTLNESMLMSPTKSISVIYGVGKSIKSGSAAHSCKDCPIEDCMMRDDRQVEIKIHVNNIEKILKASVGSSLMEVLKSSDVPIEFPCNGKGTCGACAVKFIKTIPKETQADVENLSKNKLKNGWRLACKVEVEHPLEFYIENEQMQILSERQNDAKHADRYSIAIDIGTTTVVCHLINADNGEIIDTQASANRQRKFGADVASRISHEMENLRGKKDLNQAIVSQLNEMIIELVRKNNVEKIFEVIAVGNTVMTHILLGYDILGLGQVPFTPISLERKRVGCESLGIALDCEITVMEGVDAYVGSDISVGAAFCGLMDNKRFSLLIDLGTNGELALGNKEKLFCCATAAGPAFEAANIYSGMSGVAGAISEFCYDDGYKYKTIGGKNPKGICGSGVLDITAVLVGSGVVDSTGRMLGDSPDVKYDVKLKEYFVVAEGEDDEIIFTSKDVREIQLAKAAISAGVKTLIETANINYEDIEKVYIAGGFGNYMNIKSALEIELIPKQLSGKTLAVGNTAAKGAVACHDKKFLEKVSEYVKSAQHVDLSTSIIFQNHYIESIGFGV